MRQNMISKGNQAILIAWGAGYGVTMDGAVRFPDGTTRRGYSYASREPKQYLKIFIREAQTWVYVHRLAAFQEWGDRMFQKGVYVNHKNGDGTDNSLNNLTLSPLNARVRAPRRPPTLNEMITVQEMHQKGYTSFDMASRLQRPPRFCRSLVARLTAEKTAAVA